MFRGKRCMRCHNSGYQGRIGVREPSIADDAMRELIAGGASVLDLSRLSAQRGVTALNADAWRKVDLDMATVEEVLRVIGVQSV